MLTKEFYVHSLLTKFVIPHTIYTNRDISTRDMTNNPPEDAANEPAGQGTRNGIKVSEVIGPSCIGSSATK